MIVRAVLGGLKSWIPGLSSYKGTVGTVSARYCYSVWGRHLAMLREHGLPTEFEAVAELGPGSSFGIGLAWLLSGARRYCALDVVEHATQEQNLAVLEELIALFGERADIPGDDAFPRVRPRLESYQFPRDVLTDARLAASLDTNRLRRLREELAGMPAADAEAIVRYVCPWNSATAVERGSIDLIFSQACLEHVDDLKGTYDTMAAWLKPGGVMSHVVDFSCHGMLGVWNGHWACSDLTWRLIRGRRPYLINRAPLSTHLRLAEEAGLRVLCARRVDDVSGIPRRRLARRFAGLSETDMHARTAYLLYTTA